MSLTIKAYLEKENCECEIRRFLVDEGVSSSFTYLTTKIPQVFPGLAGRQFDLYWKDSSQNSLKPLRPSKSRKRKAESSIEDRLENVKISKTNSTTESQENCQVASQDEEGDNIAFSSDEELTEALGFVSDGLFRVYIRTKLGSDSTCDEMKHPGVVCDGCSGEIYGSRFKCCVCPDYDLCFKCESIGKHNEHSMFRIKIPGQFWRPGFMGMPPYGPPPPYGAGQGPWRGMKRCWRKWMKKMYEQAQQTKDGEDFDCEKEAKEPRKEAPAKESAEKQGASSCGPCVDEDSPTEEYLKDVGESVADMLGPLGIDVNIDVECKGKRKTCTAGGRRGGGRGRGNGWGHGFMHGWGGRGGWGGWGGWGMGRMPEPMCQDVPWGMRPQQRCGPDSGRMAEGCCPEKTPEAPCSRPQTGEEDVPMGSPQRSEQSDGEWMVLTEDHDPVIPTSSSTSSQPVAQAASQNPPLHPIPKMADALQQLLAMGFSNDGGWLTQLVESKDGDLNKILDAVKPHIIKATPPPASKQ